MKKINLKRKVIALVSAVLLVGAVSTPILLKGDSSTAATPCDNGAVACGGATSANVLVQKMATGDGQHSGAELTALYGRFGIFKNDILSHYTVEGTVTKDGRVFVGSTQVASGVQNGWRTQMPGSYEKGGLYWSTPNVNFAADRLPALVFYRNGQFVWAVIKVCGNPTLVQTPSYGMTIEKKVANMTKGETTYVESNRGDAGDKLEYRIKVQNTSDVNMEGVLIRDTLPAGVTLVPGTGRLLYGTSKYTVQDATITGGARLEGLFAHRLAYLIFQVTVDNDVPENRCINLINTGLVSSDRLPTPLEDTATTLVCGPTVQQNYNITVQKYNDVDGDATRDSGESLLSGWSFTIKGNGLDQTETTGSNGSIAFEGLHTGTYTITENLKSGWRSTTGVTKTVTVGPNQTVMFGNQKTTTPPTPTPVPTPTSSQPTSLPASGPVDAAAGVVGTGALGYAGYMWKKSRKALIDTMKSK